MFATRLVVIRLARTRGANRCGPEEVASSSFCGHLQRPAVVLHRYVPLWTRRNRRVHTSEVDVGCRQASGEGWLAETEETTNIGGICDAKKVQKPRVSLRLSVGSVVRASAHVETWSGRSWPSARWAHENCPNVESQRRACRILAPASTCRDPQVHRYLGGTAPLSSLTLQLQDIARF
jgi:hypothetical protein